jgi:hypothetical protein
MKSRFLLLAFVALFSCKAEITKAKAPKDVIPHKEMVSLTKDLLLLESHIELSYGQIATFYKILNTSSDHVFKKHKISRDRYNRSFEYYAADQDKLTEIYQEVLDSLNIQINQN